MRLQQQLVDRQPAKNALVLAGERAEERARRREGPVRAHRIVQAVVDPLRRRRRQEAHAGSGAQQEHGVTLLLGRHDGAREVEQGPHVPQSRAVGRRSERGETRLHLEW